MKLAFDIFTVFAVSAGAFFFLAGTVGLIRFPDSLTRLHALTKVDNLGLGLVVLGLLPQANGLFGALKLVSIWLLVQLSGAIVTQLIAGAVRQRGPQRMTILSVFDIGLVVLILGIGASDDRRARSVRSRYRLRRLRVAVVDRLGQALCGRCRADGGGDRRRNDRHADARCGRTPALCQR